MDARAGGGASGGAGVLAAVAPTSVEWQVSSQCKPPARRTAEGAAAPGPAFMAAATAQHAIGQACARSVRAA